ncbi:hypothetical protein BJ138DRAFT_1105590 [Hygrophoropsis aurantiaca]|uniref:Uncharacterized protein n=1 Tax=Hygrophoropsis aurantiaca TaxID=72124 RepID=A0ACB7ZXQ0_9AGAM|nr:hypothetical protein BJ138DRAFT_1105590 [Hygrophoropsis aurantiaca]
MSIPRSTFSHLALLTGAGGLFAVLAWSRCVDPAELEHEIISLWIADSDKVDFDAPLDLHVHFGKKKWQAYVTWFGVGSKEMMKLFHDAVLRTKKLYFALLDSTFSFYMIHDANFSYECSGTENEVVTPAETHATLP